MLGDKARPKAKGKRPKGKKVNWIRSWAPGIRTQEPGVRIVNLDGFILAYR